MGDTIEETVVLDDATLGEISIKVKDSLMPGLQDATEKTIEKLFKASQDELLTKLDKALTKTKQSNDPDEGTSDDEETGNKVVKAGIESGEFAGIEKDSKEMRFFKATKALMQGDLLELRRLNKYAGALRLKAGYGNETTAADGAVLVPDPEFDTTIYNNLPKYGVSFQFANTQQTTHTAVYAISLDSGLQFTAVGEAVAIPGGKLGFSRELTKLQKYGVIIPATEELSADAAMNYWNVVTTETARAYARKVDEITFTDSTYGIIEAGSAGANLGKGPITTQVSGAGTTIVWDDLRRAEGLTEDGLDNSNVAWYMRKETFARLVQLKAASGTGDYLYNGWVGNLNEPMTPWGTPVRFTRVLNRSADVGANGAIAVFGDLQNYNVWNRIGMEIKMLSEATVNGSDGASFNLATQDAMAMRCIIRLLGNLPAGNAQKFVVVGAGTIS